MEDNDDLEIELDFNDIDDDPKLPTYEITSYPADFTLRGYYDKYKENKLEIPEFQRAYVWDQVRASKLIESFLLKLPVPGVFLYARRTDKKLLVVDGQQRIFSALRFFENNFDGKPFPLKNVSERFNGKTFLQLDAADKNELEDCVLRATIVQQLDPEDDSSIYQVFERLNTGAVSLNPMEVRKCVYYGSLLESIAELNKDKNWRLLIGQQREDKRLRDMELILRCLAMKESLNFYDKPMKTFLNKFMIAVRKLKPELQGVAVEKFSAWFRLATQIAIQELGEKPFHLRGRLNLAAMDSLMPILLEANDKHNPEIKRRYDLLCNNSEFVRDTTKDTGDIAVVKRRLECARRFMIDEKLSELSN